MRGACYVQKKSHWIELFDRPIVFDALSRFRLSTSLCRYSRRWCWNVPKRNEGTREGRSGIRRNDDSEVFVSDCLRKIHVQGKRTVDIETWNQLVFPRHFLLSCFCIRRYRVTEMLLCHFLSEISFSRESDGALHLLPSRSSIVTKWNEAPSASRWPTIESCNSKC